MPTIPQCNFSDFIDRLHLAVIKQYCDTKKCPKNSIYCSLYFGVNYRVPIIQGITELVDMGVISNTATVHVSNLFSYR